MIWYPGKRLTCQNIISVEDIGLFLTAQKMFLSFEKSEDYHERGSFFMWSKVQ